MAQQARARTQVLEERVTGTIVDWKGKMGWIEPDERIEHPEADLHKRKIFLGIQDVAEEIDGVGVSVSFLVYADGSGLGAMDCRPAESTGEITPITPLHQEPEPQRAGGHGRPKKPWSGGGGDGGYTKPPRTPVEGDFIAGTVTDYRGFFGWIVPDEPINHPRYKNRLYIAGEDCDTRDLLKAGAKVSFTLYIDSQGLGADNVTVVEEAPEGFEAPAAPQHGAARFVASKGARPTPYSRESNGGGKGGSKASGKAMPRAGGRRQRITEIEVTGELAEWKTGYGWITPYDAIDHPLAAKDDVKIHVAAADIQHEKKELEPGQLLQFHVFTDGAGLGAEEVMPF